MNLAALLVLDKASAPQQDGELAHKSPDATADPAKAVREQRSYDAPKATHSNVEKSK